MQYHRATSTRSWQALAQKPLANEAQAAAAEIAQFRTKNPAVPPFFTCAPCWREPGARVAKGQYEDRGGRSPLRKRERHEVARITLKIHKLCLIPRVGPGLPPRKPDTMCSARCVVHAQRCAQPSEANSIRAAALLALAGHRKQAGKRRGCRLSGDLILAQDAGLGRQLQRLCASRP